MAQRLAALRGGIDGDAQPLVDLALADHVAHPLRAKIAVFVRLAIPGWMIGSRGMGLGWKLCLRLRSGSESQHLLSLALSIRPYLIEF